MSTEVVPQLTRRRPRSFVEWRQLRTWAKLPRREENIAGFLLRDAREDTGLTQTQLAEKLGISQQAVARAERWAANPTVRFMVRWANACSRHLEIRLE